MERTIQNYKESFAKLYEELVNDFGVEKASISISWDAVYENGERTIKPHVLITF